MVEWLIPFDLHSCVARASTSHAALSEAMSKWHASSGMPGFSPHMCRSDTPSTPGICTDNGRLSNSRLRWMSFASLSIGEAQLARPHATSIFAFRRLTHAPSIETLSVACQKLHGKVLRSVSTNMPVIRLAVKALQYLIAGRVSEIAISDTGGC